MNVSRECCCECRRKDCLSGDTTDTGCCHWCDDLLLWCERPAWAFTQQAAATGLGPGGSKCQWNYTRSSAELPPVQAIYRYYGERWKCVIPTGGAETLYPLPSRCPEDFQNVGLGVTLCYPLSFYLCNNSTSHCNAPGVQICLCNSAWLTPYRKELLNADPATKWLVEMTCFKNGQALSGTYGSLYDEFLCVVHREHWWRLPIGECAAGDYLHVPNCTGGTCTDGCGTTTWQTDQLVPKWWIYACSGAPLWRFDLDDAVARGYLTGSERTTILTAIGLGNQPPQQLLKKMAQGGYFDTKDWREDQRAALQELHAWFPTAGYNLCIEDCADMDYLGPVRRRLPAPYTNPPTRVPWLDRDDAELSQRLLNVPASCFKDYPGTDADQNAYTYWAERQWVYFRAVPGGWTWVGWDAASGDCEGLSEEEAILQGCGRADDTCIEAFKGNPRPPACCVDNPPVCDTGTWTRCFGCGNPPPTCACGAAPIAGCGPFSTSPVATDCENLVVSPHCLGVRIVWAQYVNENILTAGEGTCVQTNRYRCLYTAKSYLVEARRSGNSWSDSCPNKCREEDPPLPTWNTWPVVTEGHYGIDPICDSIVSANGLYNVADLCCSGYCWAFNTSAFTPCLIDVGQKKDCPATSDCPPHSTTGQINCIGFTPDCP